MCGGGLALDCLYKGSACIYFSVFVFILISKFVLNPLPNPSILVLQEVPFV